MDSGLPGFVFGSAKLLQIAPVALGLARLADLASMMDDLVREADPAALRKDAHQFLLDFLGRFAFCQAETVRDAEDVRIHDDTFSLAVCYAEDDVGCLACRAGYGDELGKRLRYLAVEVGNDFLRRALN